MLHPDLYKKSGVYDFFIKSLGYQRSLSRYLRDIPLANNDPIEILDAGCGTGLLGLELLERFPNADLWSTDLEPNFLRATLKNADARGIDGSRVRVGIADISSPKEVSLLDGASMVLDDGSMDLICVGAVVGYAKDVRQTLNDLIALLKPGASLINMEMNDQWMGRYISKRYHYHQMPLDEMVRYLRELGCKVTQTHLGLRYFPATLTRVAVVASKAVD